MQIKLSTALLLVGLIALDPRNAAAQRRLATAHTQQAAPQQGESVTGAVIGAAVGFVLGFGAAAALYISTAPPEHSDSPAGIAHPAVMIFVGVPIMIGTTGLGALVGARAGSSAPKVQPQRRA